MLTYTDQLEVRGDGYILRFPGKAQQGEVGQPWCEDVAVRRAVASMSTQREKLVKIGAKVVRHGRYVTFQLAEVAVSKSLFQKILGLIDALRRRPALA